MAGAANYPLTSLVATDQIPVNRSDSAVLNYATPTVLADAVFADRTVLPYLSHTGGVPAASSVTGTLVSPITTSSYMTIFTIPGDMTITGVAMLNGPTSSGSVRHYLADTAGAQVAATVSTAFGATSSTYQRVAFSTPYSAQGPATFVLVTQISGVNERFRAHTFGDFPAWSTSGTTFNTFPTTGVAVVSTFTAGVGPIASLY